MRGLRNRTDVQVLLPRNSGRGTVGPVSANHLSWQAHDCLVRELTSWHATLKRSDFSTLKSVAPSPSKRPRFITLAHSSVRTYVTDKQIAPFWREWQRSQFVKKLFCSFAYSLGETNSSLGKTFFSHCQKVKWQ